MRRVFKLAILTYIAMAFAMLAWTFLWPDPEPEDFVSADAIVCLGGGMSANGTLAAPVLTRIERCVQLYEAGLAPVIVFSGGTAAPNGPNAGSQMARFAASLGVPQSVLVVESDAQSTLQNALFSLDLIPNAARVIVVTEAFHLPRSWASFKWAAWEKNHGPLNVALASSEQVRRDPQDGSIGWTILARESLAIWFNILRASAYSIAPNPDIDWLH